MKSRKHMARVAELPESWVECYGWENLYEISNLGRVRSLPRIKSTTFGRRTYGGNVLKPITLSNGYLAVNLTDSTYRKQVLVHRLVLSSFKGPSKDNQEGCHHDGNKANNRLDNLRWDTRANNHKDKIRHDTFGKLTVCDVLTIRELGDKYTARHLSREFGVSTTTIRAVVNRDTWKHI